MVWRDLDLTVVCRRHRRLEHGSDLSRRAVSGAAVPQRVGEVWRVDIWFVDERDRQPDLAAMRDLPPRLTEETRTAILLVKDAWARRPEYRREVRSWDIYTAVLDDGVRTPTQFEEWLRRRSP
jgi:hypothetical protein